MTPFRQAMPKEVVVQWIFGNPFVNQGMNSGGFFSQPHWRKVIRDPGRLVRCFRCKKNCKSQMVHRFFEEFNLF